MPGAGASELIWELRDDPEELQRLFPGPSLSNAGGVYPSVAPGPVVASEDWWQGIAASTDESPLIGIIESVDRRGFTIRTTGGDDYTARLRGNAAEYRQDRTLELIRAFPPPNFVTSNALDPDGGLLVEVWAR